MHSIRKKLSRLDTTTMLSIEEEKQRLLAAIESANGNRTLAARLLGLNRATFYRRLKEFNISTE
ncbi:MAG: helix-turn-helix domain-containing protein [Blastocatellia bacterium]